MSAATATAVAVAMAVALGMVAMPAEAGDNNGCSSRARTPRSRGVTASRSASPSLPGIPSSLTRPSSPPATAASPSPPAPTPSSLSSAPRSTRSPSSPSTPPPTPPSWQGNKPPTPSLHSGTVQRCPLCDSSIEYRHKSANNSSVKQVTNGGFMVAFAGRKYAARSVPAFVGNSSYTVTSFTLVLEFHKGTLQNLYWKRDGCASCSGRSNFVCLNKQECAIKTSNCKNANQGGSVDCSIGMQLAFSGTDKHDAVLNSWYEVSNLRQYSLYSLYSNLRDSLTSQYDKIF